jgi:RimJ/RimL family protein N-acetyltransferase
MQSFTTERLLIRPLAESDKAFYISLYSDPRIMRHIGTPLTSIEAEKNFERTIQETKKNKPKVMTWTIVCLKKNEPLGIQGLTRIASQVNPLNNADIGIILALKAHGKCFPEEAMGALIEYAFQYISIKTIRAFYATKNLATKRFIKKLGFNYDITLQPENGHNAYQCLNKNQWEESFIKKIL